MAWHSPKTWVAGELVKEGDLNEQIRDNMLVLKTAINDSGKIVAISATYFASLDGTNLTGLAKLAAGNTFSAGVQDFNGGSTTRFIAPVGSDKWAT